MNLSRYPDTMKKYFSLTLGYLTSISTINLSLSFSFYMYHYLHFRLFFLLIHRVRKLLNNNFSLFLAFHDIISSFSVASGDMNEWLFIFEDDVALHTNCKTPLCDIKAGMQLAHSDGILYLGVCPKTCYKFSAISYLDREFERCFGYCAHAFGITKWKAFSILRLMNIISFNSKQCNYGSFHKRCFFFDTALRDYGAMITPIWLVGPYYYSDNGNMRGMIYQDRVKYSKRLGESM